MATFRVTLKKKWVEEIIKLDPKAECIRDKGRLQIWRVSLTPKLAMEMLTNNREVLKFEQVS